MAKKAKPSWRQKYQRKKQERDQIRRQIKAKETEMAERLSQVSGDKEVVIVEGPSEESMSEVLQSFAGAYFPFTENEAELHRLYGIALVAWNAALKPKEERQALLDKVAETLPSDKTTQEDFYAIVEDLIERKETHFAQYKRAILDFSLTDTGDGYSLSVVSTPPLDN